MIVSARTISLVLIAWCAACVSRVDLESTPCPCGAGFFCCEALDRCLPTGTSCASDGGLDATASQSDALGSDGGPGSGADSGAGPTYRAHGLSFGPYINAGEDPRGGGRQLSEAQVTARLAAVAPYTNWIRTYGCDPDLRDIGRLAHAMGKMTAVGAWIERDALENEAEIDCLVEQAIAGHVDVAVVGTEVLLRSDATPQQLIRYMQQVKSRLDDAGVEIPVTTAEVYGVLLANPSLIEASDVVYANYYPFWEGVPLDLALAHLHVSHQQLLSAAGGKEVVVAETGWPSCGEPLAEAMPSAGAAAQYFQHFVSWARANAVEYFYFEAFDEPWKTNEGTRGTCWGLFSAPFFLKPGMAVTFAGETVEDSWSVVPPGPPVIDFFGLPDRTTTNIATYLIAGATDPGNTVKIDGAVVPPSGVDPTGVFSVPYPLAAGTNTLTLALESADGTVLEQSSKVVIYDASHSTTAEQLLYVDVVARGPDVPAIDGTVVIDVAHDTLLGYLPAKHVRGIAPDGAEIYLDNGTVIETAHHGSTRKLPFEQPILANGFVALADGELIISGTQVVSVADNAFDGPQLPLDIRTGSSWMGAPVPGQPAVAADGSRLYVGAVSVIDIEQRKVLSHAVTPKTDYVSDVALTPDGQQLLVSSYGDASGRVDFYAAANLQHLGALSELPDFAGEIGFVSETTAVVGSGGNSRSGLGALTAIDINTRKVLATAQRLPLADNLVASRRTREVFVSAGTFDAVRGKRLGVDVFVFTRLNELARTKTFFLGVNRYQSSSGVPRHDQIRRLVLKHR